MPPLLSPSPSSASRPRPHLSVPPALPNAPASALSNSTPSLPSPPSPVLPPLPLPPPASLPALPPAPARSQLSSNQIPATNAPLSLFLAPLHTPRRSTSHNCSTLHVQSSLPWVVRSNQT